MVSSLSIHFIALLLADFSNVISKQDLKFLAEADEQEVVREIQVVLHRFLNLFRLAIISSSPLFVMDPAGPNILKHKCRHFVPPCHAVHCFAHIIVLCYQTEIVATRHLKE